MSFGIEVMGQHLMFRAQVQQDTLILWAKNNLPCDITLSASASSMDAPVESFIPKNEELKLLSRPNTSDTLINHLQESLQISFVLGNPNSIHNEEYEYNLPFPTGESYMLTQGNNTSFTHNNATSKYAFDFAMPEGSYVAAARGGVVAYVIDNYKAGGEDASLLEKSNRILVCHSDGSVAVYAHLQHNGALVEVGDPVFAGQVIGLSGNTGFTTSPHLHFSVLIGNRSIPIRFRNEYTILYEGEIYGHN